ncbi:T3SS effector NleG family protein [Escherichia albertii]|uniref:T3SS effector NleG family protein n=1 Tax=Escherichia albertii TaxID=208962 RepID=UPI000931AF0E|nr:T3SS effector NleG family protein [Escherichia albertii]
MPINLTPYLTASGGLGEIPQDTLSGIRTRASNGGAQVQMGSTIVTIRSVFLGFFMGSVSPEGLSERALQTALNNVNRLERDLNGGLSGRQILASIPSPYVFPPRPSVMQTELVLEKIEKCSFNVNSSSLRATEEALTCPITLCIPEHGVIMRNAGNSDVCTLYDKESLKHLVDTSSPHPLSREKITESMIVKENSCYFDCASGSIKNVRGEITRL